MHHSEDYNGHQITADTSQRGKGWGATYQIDGGEIRQSDGRPLESEEIALKGAVLDAKSVIDRMVKK